MSQPQNDDHRIFICLFFLSSNFLIVRAVRIEIFTDRVLCRAS